MQSMYHLTYSPTVQVLPVQPAGQRHVKSVPQLPLTHDGEHIAVGLMSGKG